MEQGNVKLKGVVQTILPEIQNGTVKLLVVLDEPHHAMLRNKLRVEVNIITEQKKNTLLSTNAGPAVLQHIKAGSFHPLAVGAPKRLASLPNVPTLGELGYASANLSSASRASSP